MAGNVWEWTSSQYKPYSYDAEDGREDPERGSTRTLRGGAFDIDENHVRCAYRHGRNPELRNKYNGFRVVLSSGF